MTTQEQLTERVHYIDDQTRGTMQEVARITATLEMTDEVGHQRVYEMLSDAASRIHALRDSILTAATLGTCK